MDKLKIQPLIKAFVLVYYDPTLEIIDNKSIFYNQIKKQFTEVVHPERKALKYDMGDIDFYDPQEKKCIGINTTCFKFEDYNYEKIDIFSKILQDNLSKFSKSYNIQSFNTFTLSYENVIVINKSLGFNFNDYFTMSFDIKGEKPKDFLTTEGSFVYKANEGLLIVGINPVINPKRETEKFRFNLGFITNPIKGDVDKVIRVLKNAHEYIEDVFEKSLTGKYLDTLK
jgi:uncharacterized protein (TIGR04255 family)